MQTVFSCVLIVCVLIVLVTVAIIGFESVTSEDGSVVLFLIFNFRALT